MELVLTDEERAFRDEVRDFLQRELTPEIRERAGRATSVFVDRDTSIAWQRKLASRGWMVPSWPVEYGGVAWTPVQRFIFESECAEAGAPAVVPMGPYMVAHVIIRFGTEEQKRHYLPRIISGEDYWCQGYSEPESGSDLASLRCRAERDGSDYVVNGSKIWTTHAHFANRIFCLVRTSAEGKPQAGISFLLIDMKSPGVTVRPIISVGGDHDINQVFFDNVRVPQANRIGEEGQGWTCAKYLLEFERGGNVFAPRLTAALRRVKRLAARVPDGHGATMAEAPHIRDRIAQLELDLLSLRFTELRIISTLTHGAAPGRESSILKTEQTELQQRISELAVELLGPYAIPFQPEPTRKEGAAHRFGPESRERYVPRYLNERAASIYGGTNEIQRNLIARLVLGL